MEIGASARTQKLEERFGKQQPVNRREERAKYRRNIPGSLPGAEFTAGDLAPGLNSLP